MSAYLPVPCPRCGGLVRRDTVKCCGCGVSWESAYDLELEGAEVCSERAYKIASPLDICEKENAQPMWDAIALERKYILEVEKNER